MAEEVKDTKAAETKEEKTSCACSKAGMKIVLGIVLLALGVIAILAWSHDLLTIIRGCVGVFLLMAGIITLAIAKE